MKNYWNDVLKIARGEVGQKEKGNNDNKYGKELNNNGVAWCYLFVSWCIKKAGLNIPVCAYVPTGYLWYKNKGKLSKVPKEGYLAFFCWNKEYFKDDKSYGIPQHIGFVSKVNADGSFMCIEGNTSDVNQSEGDGVYEKKRRLSDVKAFGMPNYEQ